MVCVAGLDQRPSQLFNAKFRSRGIFPPRTPRPSTQLRALWWHHPEPIDTTMPATIATAAKDFAFHSGEIRTGAVWGCRRTLSTFSSHTLLPPTLCGSVLWVFNLPTKRRAEPAALSPRKKQRQSPRVPDGPGRGGMGTPQNCWASGPGSFATLAAISCALSFVPWQIVATPVPG